jgi:hypothetical protein
MYLHAYPIEKVRAKFKNPFSDEVPYHKQSGFQLPIDQTSVKFEGWDLTGTYINEVGSYYIRGGWRYHAPLKYTNGRELWAPKDEKGLFIYGASTGFHISPVMRCCGTLQFQGFEGCYKMEEGVPVLEAALDWLWGNKYTYALAIVVPPSRWVQVMEKFPENVHLISQDVSRRTKHTLNLYKLYAKDKK